MLFQFDQCLGVTLITHGNSSSIMRHKNKREFFRLNGPRYFIRDLTSAAHYFTGTIRRRFAPAFIDLGQQNQADDEKG